MTTDKARKRAVRTRMTKTGERYAAARRHVVADEAPADPASPAGPPAARRRPGHDRGRHRDRHRSGLGPLVPPARRLGRGGALAHRHRAVHPRGAGRQRLVGAGRDRRLRTGSWAARDASDQARLRGERLQDGRRATARTSGPRSWSREAVGAGSRRAPSAGGGRRAPIGRSTSFAGPDGTRIAVAIDARGDDRATVTVTHEGLADAEDVATRRAAWRDRLDRLAALYADRPGPKPRPASRTATVRVVAGARRGRCRQPAPTTVTSLGNRVSRSTRPAGASRAMRSSMRTPISPSR